MPTYRKPRRPPLRKESRTLPIHGTGDDEGRYFHCWNCGFVCDSQRDELGDSESEAGDDHTDFNNPIVPDPTVDTVGMNPAKQATLGGDIGHYHVAMEIGADSEPKKPYRIYTSDVSRGCPFCGSTNWRGDY